MLKSLLGSLVISLLVAPVAVTGEPKSVAEWVMG